MPTSSKIYPLSVYPGIKKDGTQFSSRNWVDGQWCRFYGGLPKKMAGYQQIYQLDNIARGTYIVPNAPNFNVYIAGNQVKGGSSVGYFVIDSQGNAIAPGFVDRTPTLFDANDNNDFQFDIMYSTTDNSSAIIMHAARNLSSIDQTINSPVYYGDSLGAGPLLETGFSVSGGIVVLHPHLFMFGNNGEVIWTDANNPTLFKSDARITGQKIVAGLATRGGNSSPAGLLWSLDSLIRVTAVYSATDDINFRFDTVTAESSILSSRGVIEYESNFYWAATDRFLMYNGVVQELPNQMNLNFFFDNINRSQREKVWVTKVPRWGEIWWFYPEGNATECNRAVIYNIREQTWYDTDINRSDGYFNQVFYFPLWTDSIRSADNVYNVWKHETGVNEVHLDGEIIAINSSIQSGIISWCAFDPDAQRQELDRWLNLERIEYDFVQSGLMTLTVKGREYPRSPEVTLTPIQFDVDSTFDTIHGQRREMTLTFSSNVVNGDFYMGQILLVFSAGDVRSGGPGNE